MLIVNPVQVLFNLIVEARFYSVKALVIYRLTFTMRHLPNYSNSDTICMRFKLINRFPVTFPHILLLTIHTPGIYLQAP